MKEIASLPRCYSFSFDTETATIIFKIQKSIVPQIQKRIKQGVLLMQYMYEKHGGNINTFINFGEKEKSFGYENSIIYENETEDDIVYSYTFSSTDIPTDEICEVCEGTKIDFNDHLCHDCHGTGKKHSPSKRLFSTALLSLYPIIELANSFFFKFIEGSEVNYISQTNKKQFIVLKYSDISGKFICSLEGWIDDNVFEWIKGITKSQEKIIIQAMIKTEEVLSSEKINEYYFRFDKNNDSFYLQIPGDYCTLSIDRSPIGMFGQIGKTLQSNNIDSRHQQILFIVALAVINDLYEEYLKTKNADSH